MTPIPQTSTDPIVNQIISVGNAQQTQAAMLQALLHAIERYQGADIAGNANWALEHARSIQALSNTLRSQLPDSTAALTALDAALSADPRDFNQGIQAAPLIAQIINNGFQVSQVQALLNAGLAPNQLAALRADVATYPMDRRQRSGDAFEHRGCPGRQRRARLSAGVAGDGHDRRDQHVADTAERDQWPSACRRRRSLCRQ